MKVDNNSRTILDSVDFYKLTMGQVQWLRKKGVQVTFSLLNRKPQIPILRYLDVPRLMQRLEEIRERGFTEEDLELIEKLPEGRIFKRGYLDYLRGMRLPEVKIVAKSPDLVVETRGEWPVVSLWETVILGEISENYHKNELADKGVTTTKAFLEGESRLLEKVEVFRKNPGIKIVDFGTRRRFSFSWQERVLKILQSECPGNLLGTSNVAMAALMGIPAIGTFAHEMPMVYAASAMAEGKTDEEVRNSQVEFLKDWYKEYGEPYSIALSDTFGTASFLEDFPTQFVREWRGIRQDSGDPHEIGRMVVDYYHKIGVDPTKKTLVFSDGLTLPKIVELYEEFSPKIKVVFGWGTNLTNDLGFTPLSIVIKATEANGKPTVKLSDQAEKHLGDEEIRLMYRRIFASKAVSLRLGD